MENDQTKLTQFAAPSSEVKSSNSFFAKLFGKINGENGGGSDPAIAYTPARRNKVAIQIPDQEAYPEAGASTFRRNVVSDELRTVHNVLRRLANILDKKSSSNEGLRPYKDSDFQQSWMPDSSCKECYDCSSKFTTFIRRHHCRICGQIFCSSCCNQEVPGRVIGFAGGLRACTYCCGVVSDLMEGSNDDLGTFRDNLKAQLTDSTTNTADLRSTTPAGTFTPSRRLSTSDSFETPSNRFNRIASIFDIAPTQEPMEDMTFEERQSLVKDSLQLKSLFFEMLDPVDGVPLASRRYRLKAYPYCFQGHELIKWLIDNDKAFDNHQAKIIGQALLDAKCVLCLTDSNASIYSSGDTLYQFRSLTYNERKDIELNTRRHSLYPDLMEDMPNWVQELDQSASHADLSTDFGQSGRSIGSALLSGNRDSAKSNIADTTFDFDSRTNVASSLLDCDSARLGSNEQLPSGKEVIHIGDREPNLPSTEPLIEGDDPTLIHNQFRTLYKDHIQHICEQLLERSRVPLSWTDILVDLSSNISHFVKPDVRLNKDQMDITSYVHIKKVRSGQPVDSDVTYGVICTKTVIHNRMKTSIRSPQIMLLQSSIEYQRVTNKLSSLDPQILQEQEYLNNCVARICKYKPDVLLVENTVSRVAQQLLLEAGITVVINVKASVMLRIARLTMADIIPSIDSLLSPPQLGTCFKFKTDVYRFHDGYYKTLMIFKGCPANLGCTVMLRGERFDELVKVKPILLMLISACFHAKLELSYMIDVSASPSVGISYKTKRRHLSGESKDSVDLSESSQDSVTFSKVLHTLILDYSPFIMLHAPYFETERGKLCRFRQLFPAQMYWSPLLAGTPEILPDVKERGMNEMYDHKMEVNRLQTLTAEIKPPHEFATQGINCPASHKQHKDMVSMFRASGGRLNVKANPYYTQESCIESATACPPPQSPDCFDIANHQRVSVLFSSYTTDSGLHSCVKPWIVHMYFYGKNDITLGEFLELYCFRPAYQCPRPDCEVPMLEHIRRFVHSSGSLFLLVKKLFQPDASQSTDATIYTWRWCKRCRKATAVSPLSPITWHMSFAKFLQLHLACTLIGSQISEDCVHSMSKDYYQYFRCKDLVATFKYTSIITREVLFPHPHVGMQHKISKDTVEAQIRIIHTHGLGLFSDVMETFCTLESRDMDTDIKKQLLISYKSELEKEKSWFTQEVDAIETKLTEEQPSTEANGSQTLPTPPEYAVLQQLEEKIISLKCHLSRAVQEWNIRIEDFNMKEDKSNEKKVRSYKSLDGHSPGDVRATEDSLASADSEVSLTHATVSSKDPEGPVMSTADDADENRMKHSESLISSYDSTNDLSPHPNLVKDREDIIERTVSCPDPQLANSLTSATVEEEAGPQEVGAFIFPTSSPDVQVAFSLDTDPFNEGLSSMNTSRASSSPQPPNSNSGPLFVAPDRPASDGQIPASESQVSASADDATNTQGPELGMVSGDLASAPNADPNKFDDQEGSEKTMLTDGKDLTTSYVSNKDNKLRRFLSSNESQENFSNLRHKKPSRKSSSRYFLDSVKTAIMSPQEDTPIISLIENPFSDNEHFLLQPTVSVPVIVYDEEPSSIIAYALGSQTYEANLIEYQKHQMMASKPPVNASSSQLLSEKECKTDDIEAVLQLTSISSITASLKASPMLKASSSAPATISSLPEDWKQTNLSDCNSCNAHQSRSTFDFDDTEQAKSKAKDRGDIMTSGNPHVEMEFTEKSVSGDRIALFYCKVYFAAEFKKLRRLVFPEGESQFVRSLSRCYKWNAKGGKSGLGFCKTKDERFIMKQMGRQEIQSFMDFGPHYFNYLMESLNQADQTKGRCTLAKILGVYRIGLKNFVTNAVFKQDVLIIENLFYGHKVNKVFDLKGSDRNRLVKKETSVDSVLLDENFMRYSKQSPIYIREHSKKVLMNTLVCDSQFLAKHTVMDYSLLCGYDEDTKELVIGIIDYIRTFTWDKKLETVVKSSGILGGQGKMPTIVSPELYRTRFMEAMERYFNVVPDRWTGFAINDI